MLPVSVQFHSIEQNHNKWCQVYWSTWVGYYGMQCWVIYLLCSRHSSTVCSAIFFCSVRTVYLH